MTQMTVKDLKFAIADLDDKLEVFFRRVAPLTGNIEEAFSVELSEYAFFGQTVPCVILEPAKDE